MQPWVALVEQVVAAALAGSPLAALAPDTTSPAVTIVALYLGLDMLSRFDTNFEHADAVFGLAAHLCSLASPPLS
jgi:hypothetical protein